MERGIMTIMDRESFIGSLIGIIIERVSFIRKRM